MRTTEGTTPAPESASTTADELVHFYWVNRPEDGWVCGLNRHSIERDADDETVDNVGGIMAIRKRRDCPACVRILELTWRCVENARRAREVRS